ncbi:MAG: haloacid dehalogenase-like hydrolase [Microthrixaceae bacterium]
MSASLRYYLDPIARHLDMTDVIAVELEERDGVLTGALSAPNVRAEQKALRLREWLGIGEDAPMDGVELWAYGNSSGDHALLELADHAYWLGRPDARPPEAVQFRGRTAWCDPTPALGRA